MKLNKIDLRLIALLLLLAMAATLAVSCGEAKPNSPSASGETDAQATEEVVTTEAVVTRKPLDVPKGDYNGHDFHVMSIKRSAPGTYNQYLDFAWSQDNAGETINDAVYQRNLKVEEDFNITITNEEVADVTSSARKVILAGGDEYDVVQPYINHSYTLAQEGLLLDFYSMPGIDITNEWWDAAILRDLALCRKMYVMTGDISMADEELNYAVFFNKTLTRQYDLGDLYQCVRDDQWVFDKMIECASIVTHDLDGDGVIGENDVTGILTDLGITPIWFYSFGGYLAKLDDVGKPVLVVNNERTVQILDKLTEVLHDPQLTLCASKCSNTWTTLDQVLMADRGLFRIGSVYDITEYRQMINDFGILPYPKFDETQDNFYHIIATQVCAGICVPVTASDPERTGILLEALAYASKDTVTKAYYDVNLYTKVARDDESGEMLDIIFGTKRYDIAKVFGWGSLESVMNSAVSSKTSFTTLYASAEEKAQAALEKSYELFLSE